MALEEAFEIEFDDDEIATMKCLDDLVRAVEGHLGDEGAAGVRVPL
jgi:acyl carrier protein